MRYLLQYDHPCSPATAFAPPLQPPKAVRHDHHQKLLRRSEGLGSGGGEATGTGKARGAAAQPPPHASRLLLADRSCLMAAARSSFGDRRGGSRGVTVVGAARPYVGEHLTLEPEREREIAHRGEGRFGRWLGHSTDRKFYP